MSEMIERVAQAISGSDKPEDVLKIHRNRARLALKAMDEPTAAMLRAGEEYNCENVRAVWQAMLDEALK
jgi:hypothetical protein